MAGRELHRISSWRRFSSTTFVQSTHTHTRTRLSINHVGKAHFVIFFLSSLTASFFSLVVFVIVVGYGGTSDIIFIKPKVFEAHIQWIERARRTKKNEKSGMEL